MNWKLKCLAFHVCRLPGGKKLYDLLQRRVTGNALFNIDEAVLHEYRFHLDNFKGGTAMEFGCGSNLLAALLLSKKADRIYALDLERLATVEKVNHVIKQIGGPLVNDLGDDLKAKYKIDYRAPYDARHTDLSGIDFIYSTSVLEHIPPKQIDEILTECKRVAPQAIHSHVIGYVDHYAHSDSRISYFNFYKYGRTWALFNPPNHYQSRLRHSDFVEIFKRHGINVSASVVMSKESRRDPGLKHAKRFAKYSQEDLYAHDGLFVTHL